MIRLGDKSRFAVEISESESADGLRRRVDCWAANRWLTCDDNRVFVPTFLAQVEYTLEKLRRRLDLDLPFPELSPEENHRRLYAEDDERQGRYKWETWGPTTDNVSTLLFRRGEDFLLTFAFPREAHNKPEERGVVFAAVVPEAEFIDILEKMANSLQTGSQGPNMSQDEWNREGDPDRMLAFLLRCGASPRQLRLAACGAVRRIWHLLQEEQSHATVELAEQFAEGRTTEAELHANYRSAPDDAAFAAAFTAHGLADEAARHSLDQARLVFAETAPLGISPDREWAGQCDLLRDIFHPFRTAKLNPAWKTDTVVQLAESCYEKRSLPSGHLDSDRLAVLADALEEAGCTDTELLTHLRSLGPHVRGCWAIDVMTGRC